MMPTLILASQPVKLLVSGSRDHADTTLIYSQLDIVHDATPISVLIHGAAKGADLIAENWAKVHQVPYLGVPALWNIQGRSAGPERNARMLTIVMPDIAIFFPLPHSVGTHDMLAKVQAHNAKSPVKIKIIVVPPRM